MADGKVTISTQLDNSGLKKGIGQISGSLGGLKSVIGKITGMIAAAFAVLLGITAIGGRSYFLRERKTELNVTIINNNQNQQKISGMIFGKLCRLKA